MTELPKPDYARNMRVVGHTDQGGRPDGVQVMVHRGFAFVGHMFSKGFSVIDVRDPKKPRAANYIAAPRKHLEHPPAGSRRSAVGHSRQGHVRCSRICRRARLLQRRPRQDRRHGRGQANARLERRSCGLRHLEAGDTAPDRFHAGRGRRHPPRLVHRRALGLRVGSARRFHRLHVHDGRHERSREAAGSGALVDSRHEPGGRGDAIVAGGAAIWPAPRDHSRRHGLRRLARCRHGRARYCRPREAQTDHPPQLVTSVRRRHT